MTTRSAPPDRVPALSEAEFQRQVLDLATVLGWEYVHFRPAQTSRGWRTPVQGPLGKGWPDLFLARHHGRDRRFIFAELKREGGELTPEQEHVRSVILEIALSINCGTLVAGDRSTAYFKVDYFLWHPSDFDEITAILR